MKLRLRPFSPLVFHVHAIANVKERGRRPSSTNQLNNIVRLDSIPTGVYTSFVFALLKVSCQKINLFYTSYCYTDAEIGLPIMSHKNREAQALPALLLNKH